MLNGLFHAKGIKALLGAVALGLVVLLAGSIVSASIPGPSALISACCGKNDGSLRVIDAAGVSCNSAKELPLSWNQTGPQGPPGPQGPAGTVPQAISDFVDRFGGPNPAVAGHDDANPCTLGEVHLTAGSRGRGLPAAGQVLPIGQNQALFTLLGTRFGGDGITTFRLPDLRGLAPKGLTYTICASGSYPAVN